MVIPQWVPLLLIALGTVLYGVGAAVSSKPRPWALGGLVFASVATVLLLIALWAAE